MLTADIAFRVNAYGGAGVANALDWYPWCWRLPWRGSISADLKEPAHDDDGFFFAIASRRAVSGYRAASSSD